MAVGVRKRIESSLELGGQWSLDCLELSLPAAAVTVIQIDVILFVIHFVFVNYIVTIIS
jgi:hypothetical protein